MKRNAELDKLTRTTEGEVFDKTTLDAVWRLMNSGAIDSFDFPISTGKEGTVFRAIRRDGFVAVKIYRINTATFKSISKHLMYHAMPNRRRDRRSLILSWAHCEFTNLSTLYNAGVRVPQPHAREGNAIVMEYIGTEQQPSPLLKTTAVDDPESFFNTLLGYVRCMYRKARLVHADLSPYNVLVYGNEPVIIDVGQAVPVSHPMSFDFLKRDITTVANFFAKQFQIDTEKILQFVTGCTDEIR
jgi:RIO kinase 1